MSMSKHRDGFEHYQQVALPTPFHARTSACNELNLWHRWRDYSVPDAYFSVALEYTALRNAAAVFDLSPMSKHWISGPDAEAFLNRLITRDVKKIAPGKVAYCLWCDEDGQLIDDGTLFHIRSGEYLLCSQERQMDWLQRAAVGFAVTLSEKTHDWAALAVQGPVSYTILAACGYPDIARLKPFELAELDFNGVPLMLARTGFTGDLGYELFIAREAALALWDHLFAHGQAHGLKPMGTHALDIARIEAGFIQAGVDFLPADHAIRHGRAVTPIELDLGWQVDLAKPFFNGRAVLAKQKRHPTSRQLLRLKVSGNKIAKDAYLYNEQREKLGTVTSAVWSPMLKQSIALALVEREKAAKAQQIIAEIYYQKELQWSRVNVPCERVTGAFFDPSRRKQTPPARY